MTLPETPRGRPGQESGLHSTTSPAATIPDPADITAVLALSDERDAWMRRIDRAYRDGFRAGRATACITLAEMEQRREARLRHSG